MNITKSLLTIASFTLIMSCNKTTKEQTTDSKVATPPTTEKTTTPTIEKVSNKRVKKATKIGFLTDVTALEKETTTTPIKNLIALAKTNASSVIAINKDNIKASLQTAKAYKHAVIVVGVHTAVKVTDLADCKASGAWGACMPMAEGYIKRGALNYKKDYINNIIGLPDTQERTMYLFN